MKRFPMPYASCKYRRRSRILRIPSDKLRIRRRSANLQASVRVVFVPTDTFHPFVLRCIHILPNASTHRSQRKRWICRVCKRTTALTLFDRKNVPAVSKRETDQCHGYRWIDFIAIFKPDELRFLVDFTCDGALKLERFASSQLRCFNLVRSFFTCTTRS